MDRYNFNIIEKKWQKTWEDTQVFKTTKDKNKKKILCFRNVSLSIWKNSYGTR